MTDIINKGRAPLVNDSFRDSTGRWGSESKRDAQPQEFDTFGEPIDDTPFDHNGTLQADCPFYRYE